MSIHSGDDYIEPSREGLFDAQLSFSVPYIEAPQPLTSIIKRDGREVPFEKRKIAEAIFKAAQAAGEADRDEAESLASGVAIYLSKRLNGASPRVDDVHDAVERVLIELGHARTALAYARYRDKRARIRKLREGDVRSFLTEFEEGQRDRGELASPGDVSIYVRRGDERMDGWNRDKIVDALVRETELDRATATVIALEVERQILNARVESPTASLVRELVDAKLIEFGLEEYRRRHMRLGVPLYDAEQIICMPNQTVGQAPRDPASTDAVLAERVKKEFALTQVFSREVVDAHFAGDIFLHHLGQIDRFVSSVESLEYITRHGAAKRAPGRLERPPADSDALCVHLAQHTAELARHYSGGVTWDGVNLFSAPFVPNAGDGALEDFSFQLLAHLAAANLERVALNVYPLLPPHLAELEAAGPAGVSLATTYSEFAHSAQRVAWYLLDAYKEGGPGDTAGRLPLMCLHLDDAFFQHPSQERFLAKAAETALERGGVTFCFGRGHAMPVGLSWQPSRVAVHDVTLNLPRVAYLSENDQALFTRLQHALRAAVLAHVQKAAFMARLMTWKDMGPLSMLARDFDGQPYLDAHVTRYAVSVSGLNESVQHMTGRQIHESIESVDLAIRIVAHLRACCDAFSDEYGLHLELTDCSDADTANRFAMLDLQQFPAKAQAVVKAAASQPHDVSYTPGIRVAAVREVNPMQRLRLEGMLHDYVEGVTSRIALPDPDVSGDALASFLRTAHHRTRCRRFMFAY